jgi:hypothetical protein
MTTTYYKTKSPRERAEEIAAEQKAEREQREVESRLAEINQSLKALHKESAIAAAAFWSQDLQSVVTPDVPGRADAEDLSTALPILEGERNHRAERVAFEDFITNLTARSGFTLSTAGAKRLVAYVNVQQLTHGADMAQRLTWEIAFDRLYQCGAFEKNAEIGYDPALRTVAPEPEPAPAEPTFDELLRLPAETIEDRRRLKAAGEKALSLEARPNATEWIADLEQKHGIVMNDESCEAAFKLFRDHNWSYLDRRNFDRCRVLLVKQGIFPATALTEDEKISIELQDINLTQLSFAERSALKARIRAVQRS